MNSILIHNINRVYLHVNEWPLSGGFEVAYSTELANTDFFIQWPHNMNIRVVQFLKVKFCRSYSKSLAKLLSSAKIYMNYYFCLIANL